MNRRLTRFGTPIARTRSRTRMRTLMTLHTLREARILDGNGRLKAMSLTVGTLTVARGRQLTLLPFTPLSPQMPSSQPKKFVSSDSISLRRLSIIISSLITPREQHTIASPRAPVFSPADIFIRSRLANVVQRSLMKKPRSLSHPYAAAQRIISQFHYISTLPLRKTNQPDPLANAKRHVANPDRHATIRKKHLVWYRSSRSRLCPV